MYIYSTSIQVKKKKVRAFYMLQTVRGVPCPCINTFSQSYETKEKN